MRITRALFIISDFFAWAVCAICTLEVLVLPFAEPAYARMNSQSLSTLELAGTCAMLAGVAVGTFLFTRRQPFGLVLLLPPAIVFLVSGSFTIAAVYLAVVLLLFATPFWLVYLEVKK